MNKRPRSTSAGAEEGHQKKERTHCTRDDREKSDTHREARLSYPVQHWLIVRQSGRPFSTPENAAILCSYGVNSDDMYDFEARDLAQLGIALHLATPMLAEWHSDPPVPRTRAAAAPAERPRPSSTTEETVLQASASMDVDQLIDWIRQTFPFMKHQLDSQYAGALKERGFNGEEMCQMQSNEELDCILNHLGHSGRIYRKWKEQTSGSS